MGHLDTEAWLAGVVAKGKRILSSDEGDWADQIPALLRRRYARRMGIAAVFGVIGLAALPSAMKNATAEAFIVAAVIPGVAGVLHGFVAGKRSWRALAGLLAVGLCTIKVMVIGLHGIPLDDFEAVTVSFFGALVLMGWGHLTALLGHHLRSRESRDVLREDVEGRQALEFEGPSQREWPSLPAALRTALSQAPDRGVRPSVAILPRTGWLVSVNRRPVNRLVRVDFVNLAVPRCHALRVSLPHSSLDDGASGVRKLCKRTLSPEERRELRNHARRLRRLEPTWTLLFLGALTLIGLHVHGRPGQPWPADLFLWIPLAIGAAALHARQWVAAWLLDRDARLRWVATIDGPSTADTAPVLEILPFSHVAWTEHGQPARWRHTPD